MPIILVSPFCSNSYLTRSRAAFYGWCLGLWFSFLDQRFPPQRHSLLVATCSYRNRLRDFFVDFWANMLSLIAAALTIPSALALTVEIYPGDSERASAIAIFGGCTAVGNSVFHSVAIAATFF